MKGLKLHIGDSQRERFSILAYEYVVVIYSFTRIFRKYMIIDLRFRSSDIWKNAYLIIAFDSNLNL